MAKRHSTGPGRPTLTSPALLFTFRRGKTLVDLLASGASVETLQFMARAWEQDENGKRIRIIDTNCDYPTLVQNLARHCLEQYRLNKEE